MNTTLSILAITGITAVQILAATPKHTNANAATSSPLAPPPQDQGLPYTRSAQPAALAKIKDGTAVFAGSRYGYVNGFRVRLSDTDLLRAEAVLKDGKVFVPGSFAAILNLKEVKPAAVPADLAAIADRWVYAPEDLAPRSKAKFVFTPPAGLASIDVRGTTYYSLSDYAKIKGLKVTLHPRGLLYIGDKELTFGANESVLLDSVITLFDTPDKFADPDIATRSIPTLTRQGKWTDHVKVTPEQMAVLNGPETEWPTAPKAAYDFKGFNEKLLGSKVQAPGVYPRLLFSAKDIPMLAARVKSTTVGQMSLIEMEHLFKITWWDPKTSDGQIFEKLASGHLQGLEWDIPEGKLPISAGQQFKGQKAGIYNSHVAYVMECLTGMALYCLLTNDDAHGQQTATAIANFYKLREPLIDQWLQISDSEFGSSLKNADGSLMELNALGAKTHWRNIHGLIAHMNLGLSLDLAGKWMTPEQKDLMRRVIAKATYGRRSHGQDAPVRFRDVNWMAWDLPHYIAVAAIENLPGFDAEAYASGAESARAFCDWGIDNSGVIYESTGKSPGSLQFQLLSMVILARRGENLFGHPNWRKLVEGSIQMSSPSGRVMVNSGTQYAPYSRQKLSFHLVTQLKAFYPESKFADYWLSSLLEDSGADTLEKTRLQTPDTFSAEEYRKKIATNKRLRLPSLTYPGMVRNVLYDADMQPATRADLKLPLDFNAPVQGVFSSYSDRTPEAAWMHLYVRPSLYLGAGHHHADAGMFHFSALGVDWFTQSPFTQEYAGKYFNLVQVDGESEPTNIAGGPNGYNGAATYLGSKFSASAAVGAADLTYAYSWRWNTQPPQVWADELKAMPWELEPSPEIMKIFAGTGRYKLRPWWANYTYGNYIPTSRAPFNPMQYVFRSTGLVKGAHPYGFVIDDLRKDNADHLYQWLGLLNGGVWWADVPGLPVNMIALASSGVDPKIESSEQHPALTPKPGDPLLLVCALGTKDSGDPQMPLFEVKRLEGPKDRNGKTQYFDRLAINQKAKSVAYRVLLLPVKFGEPLPKVSYDNAKQTATVQWDNQSDTLQFTMDARNRSLIEIRRGHETLIK